MISNNKNAMIELKHIELELQNNRTHHFRHFIDQYYCYKHNHVNRSGKAHWESMVWKGFVSAEASVTSNRKDVVKEHVIPLKVITKILVEHSKSSALDVYSIAKILDENLIFATISQREDKLLRDAKLTSKMPSGFWEPGHALYNDQFARYKEVGISMLEKSDTKSNTFAAYA
ncbi:TPA: hypothetical protein ACG4N8_005638 [Pseudomonas aeruginosa]|uniref:hypothetical protein n=1 Tax=Pseudomonas aeruginosa TaxID=287 RepID=UPI0018C4752C|nr:hypothetical protein [Pseudomonas aeruginosa]MBG4707286.1 hypothetical protein [Pseudomonas aeruginosa]MBI8511938.1 hypothetical protein [Pseudomonas aeruginosa]HEJ3144906.1 hypothetical protein [Pseudomonas aeruginosa]HEK1282102.1 hypothetical protein [Pseudomonas aeruginosa]HEK1305202.1 hypothetical protein [Pseudomonas aeruginosa]